MALQVEVGPALVPIEVVTAQDFRRSAMQSVVDSKAWKDVSLTYLASLILFVARP